MANGRCHDDEQGVASRAVRVFKIDPQLGGVRVWRVKRAQVEQGFIWCRVGMFPLILTGLNGDYKRGYP